MAFWQAKTFLCHLCCVKVVEAGDRCLGITYLIFKHVNEASLVKYLKSKEVRKVNLSEHTPITHRENSV